MDSLETKRLEMFRRVLELESKYASQFPADSYGGGLFKRLGEVIKGLEEHALRQSEGRSVVSEGVSSKSAVRDEIFRRLEAISRTARVMAYTSPGLEDKFRLVRGIGDEALLIMARTFSSNAEPLKADFILRGMAPTFLEDLNDEIAALDAAVKRKTQGRSAHVSASAEIDDLIERGMRAVREIEALFRNTFADDPAALAAWESASHVERRGARNGRPKSPANSTPPSQ